MQNKIDFGIDVRPILKVFDCSKPFQINLISIELLEELKNATKTFENAAATARTPSIIQL